jgi:hypothetical protein
VFSSVDKRTRARLRTIWWLLVLGGFVLAAISTYEGRFKSTEAYKGALATARTDPELIEAIGAPIHEGLFPEGEYRSTSDSSGCWSFEIPVSGSEGSATVRVLHHDEPAGSRYTFMVAELDDSQRRIDLLGEGESRVVC